MTKRAASGALRALWNPKFFRHQGRAEGIRYSENGFSWGLLLYRETLAALGAFILGVLISGFTSAGRGLAGFIAGFLVVYICFTLGVAAALGARYVRVGVPQALLVSYVVKVLLMALVLMLVPTPEALKHGWTLGGAVIGAVLWLSVEAITIMNSRILYFDPKS